MGALLTIWAGWNAPADPPEKEAEPRIKFGGSWRLRVESWDWFDPQSDFNNEYSYVASLLKGNVSVTAGHFDFLLELSQTTLLGIPDDAIAPGAEGQLGTGAAYYAHNQGQDGTLSVHQAYVRLRNLFSEHSSLRLGRFEFSEGFEATPKDATLAWLQQKRIAERLLSTYPFTHVQTALDGLQYVWDSPKLNIDLLAARPTEGALRLNAWDDLDINILYGAMTVPLPSSQARVFVLNTRDERDEAIKADNRPLAERIADRGDVNVTTFGANYFGAWDAGAGKADLLAWGALQRGQWGALDQKAWSAALEAGYQLPKVTWQPWLRFGWSRATGDNDPGDGTHGTFFPHFAARPYSRFPFYANPMNTEDLFVQLLLRPTPLIDVRIDFHRIALTERQDLWYAGGYAFRDDAFGYTGRPGNGHKRLSSLLDASLDYKLGPRTRMVIYGGLAFGGDVTGSIYASNTATFCYFEIVHSF